MRRAASGLVMVGMLLGGSAARASVNETVPARRPLGPTTPVDPLSPDATAQLARVRAAKRARTGAGHKLAPTLLARAERTGSLAASDAGAATGTTTVDVTAAVDDALLAGLAALGTTVLGAYPRFHSVRAEVPNARLDDLARLPQVRRVVPAQVPVHQGGDAVPRGVRLAAQGSVASEGEATHDVAAARTTFAVDGTGVKVCVLSDGVDDLALSQGSGNVPAVDVLPGQAGQGREGLAMLEIVHDLAPGATLGFATGFSGAAAMATNILALQAAGCRVIVDDLGYPLESAFQDDIITEAVNIVAAAGVTYLSSAGNSGALAAGTSGTWEGDYVAGPAVANGNGAAFHDFDAGAATNIFNRLANATGRVLTLSWPEPLGGAVTDYDLLVVDSSGQIVAVSAEANATTGFAIEAVEVPPGAGLSVVVALDSGPATLIRVHVSRGQLLDYATNGSTFGHNAALNGISVAAAPAAVAVGPGNPTGPHPGVFTAASPLELFSADGPRRLYFSATGTPYTPGNASSTGGVVLHKPDLAAADGTQTSVSGFARFFGTSAAAPHAAAIAALLRQHRPAATTAQVAAAMRIGSIDLGAPGYDADSGYGIVMAPAALAALTAATAGPPVPTPVEPDFVPMAPQRLLETRPEVGQVGYSGARPGQGQVIELQVTGAGSPPVPTDAAAVALNVTGTGATAAGFVTVWPCGAVRPTASNLNLAPGDTRANLVVAKVGAGGKVCLYTLNPTHLLADLAGYMPGLANFRPVVPERLLETRPAGQTGYAGAKPAPGQTIELQVTGVGATNVPADAAAVVLNVTATEATVAGFVTVYPCGSERSTASNLNLSPSVTAANLVVAKLGAGGRVCLFTQWGGHLLADIAGYQPATTKFVSINPLRVLDTRTGVGPPTGPPAVGKVVTLPVRGVAGVPATATTVVLNVTATDVVADGFVTVWPCAEARPLASNVNVPRRDTRPNLVFAKVDAAGQVCLFTLQPMALVADLVGWYP